MSERIDNLITELQTQVLKQASILNDHQRRLDNIIIPGKVASLSEDNKRIIVKHGSCKTPEIKWLAPSAGGVTEYRAPSIGEQVILLNLKGGKDTSKCVALTGLTSADFPFAVAEPNKHIRHYPDGTVTSYDHQDKILTLDLACDAVINAKGNTDIATEGNTNVMVKGDVAVKADGKASVESKGTASVKGSQVLLNSSGAGTDELINASVICPYTKSPHVKPGIKVYGGTG